MSELPDPSFRTIFLRELPGFLTDGFLPLLAYYAGSRVGGLAAGIVCSVLASAALWAFERRRGRDGLLIRISLAFVLVQAAIGFAAHSATVFLAQPVLANGVWALAFLASAAWGKPLAGTFARAWYPFPDDVLRSASFRRVYGFESLVWGAYLLARSALRLTALLHGGIGSFLVVSFVTGTPTMILLVAWSVWYATRRLPVALEREFAAAPSPAL